MFNSFAITTRRLKNRSLIKIPYLNNIFDFHLEHEKRLGELARSIGFKNVTLSSDIMPMIKIVPRGTSAIADAYLTPCIQQYLKGFFAGFDENLNHKKVEFMQSDGGLTPVQKFSGFRAILSGPAGGVVGYAKTSFSHNEAKPVIGFDMGGKYLIIYPLHFMKIIL